jgi:hypothetical protein
MGGWTLRARSSAGMGDAAVGEGRAWAGAARADAGWHQALGERRAEPRSAKARPMTCRSKSRARSAVVPT